MKKGKSITILSIICVVMAFLLVMTFARFPLGETKNFNSVLGAIELDYDMAGGTAYTLTLSKDDTNDSVDVDQVISTLGKRMTALGYQSYQIKALKSTDDAVLDYDIRIEAKGITNEYGEVDVSTLSSDVAVAAAYGKLQFFGGDSANPSTEILKGIDVIADASYLGLDADSSSYVVSIEFTSDAYDKLMELISSASSYYLKISLGTTELLSGSSAITKNYFNGKSLAITTSTEAQARQATLQIKSGGLAYKYDISDGVAISAPLGKNAPLFAIIGVSVIILLSIILLAVLYKGFGIASALSMILFVELELLMLIAIPGIKLSFGGVIGIALAVLFVADGLFITGKRIKEESQNGKMVKSAIKTGFSRALKPNLVVGIVSALVSGVIFVATTGVVRNFAITFGIGSILCLITTLLISKLFVNLLMPLFKNKNAFLGFGSTKEDK